ncbi:MAG TPA: hypothetical protein VMM76_27985 [Pirellulaceae bacterium]|nr:hypothetical protein [Pirellulaceae bacterium]
MVSLAPEIVFAYCELLYRVAIHVRAYQDIDRKQVWALMEATENIPLYIRSGNPDSLDAVRYGIEWYDREFSDKKFGLHLDEIYQEGLARFRESSNS